MYKHTPKVPVFMQPKTTFKRSFVIGVRLDRVPTLTRSMRHNVLTAVRSDNTIGMLNVPRNFMQSVAGNEVDHAIIA